MNGVTKGTIIRTALLFLALVNNILDLFGKSPLPIDDVELENLISLIFTIATALTAWWKNNSFTQEAIKADDYLERLRGHNKL